MSRRGNRKRKERRKERRHEALDRVLSIPGDGSRVRDSFYAQERSGDAVEIDLTFSGIPVPVEPEATDPGEGLLEKTAILRHQVEKTRGTRH